MTKRIVKTANLQSMVDKQYGGLLVIACAETTSRARMLCRCECGTIKTVFAMHLLSGATRSCGEGDCRGRYARRTPPTTTASNLKPTTQSKPLAMRKVGKPFERDGRTFQRYEQEIKPN